MPVMPRPTDRGFTHPNLGREVRIEQHGNEVRLIFVTNTRGRADSLREDLLTQLKAGALHITLMGKPSSIEET